MHLFISYSHTSDEKEWVLEHVRALRNRTDHEVWLDEAILPAQDWWHSILEHIESADSLIYVMTPKSAESIYCLAEIRYALSLNKPVVPLMLKTCDYPKALEHRRIQYQVIADGTTPEGVLFMIERAIGAIREEMVEDKYRDTDKRKYAPPDPRPPRPDEPKPTRSAASEIFRRAEEAAKEDNFTLAEKLFQQVIDTDPKGYGQAAMVRLEEIRHEDQRNTDYQNIVEMEADPATRQGAAEMWKIFVKMFPGHDPNGIAPRLTGRRVLPISVTEPPGKVVLPPPFEWIVIPEGKVRLIPDSLERGKSYLKRDTIIEVPEFSISKYPLTNAQFERFVAAGGYREERWWTPAGWSQREIEGWLEPRYRQNSRLNSEDQPIVGVSWHEAMAFCRWWSEVSGENVMLPTEEQWQRAAQGDDGRTYPWGSLWGKGKNCNNSVYPTKSDRTTPVRLYEKPGHSPFGVVDMVGNIWEWCLTAYWSGSVSPDRTEARVLRGGSWYETTVSSFRVSFRRKDTPDDWDEDLGFRCVCSH